MSIHTNLYDTVETEEISYFLMQPCVFVMKFEL